MQRSALQAESLDPSAAHSQNSLRSRVAQVFSLAATLARCTWQPLSVFRLSRFSVRPILTATAPTAEETSFYAIPRARRHSRTPARLTRACCKSPRRKSSPPHAACWRTPMPSWQKIARRIRVPLGFLFAAVYVWLAHPTWPSIILGSCIAVTGLAIRALASGHVRKNEQLTTTGPYAYTRNPLYLGSLVMACGFTLASRTWILAAIAIAMLIAIYLPVIRSEEDFLRARFPDFDDYCRNLPRLFPPFP